MIGRDANPADPMEAARRFSRPVLPKRFYARAEMVAEEGGFALRLDGKGARTPARNRLVVAAPRLAEAIAAEWNAQGEHIDPAAMPATRLANTAIDGVAPRRDEVRAEILGYGAPTSSAIAPASRKGWWHGSARPGSDPRLGGAAPWRTFRARRRGDARRAA